MASLEGQGTKAKEAPSSHEVRLTPLDTNPVYQCLGESLSISTQYFNVLVSVTTATPSWPSVLIYWSIPEYIWRYIWRYMFSVTVSKVSFRLFSIQKAAIKICMLVMQVTKVCYVCDWELSSYFAINKWVTLRILLAP